MRHPREWLATEPDIDDDTPRPARWWHGAREWGYDNGPESRWRLNVGDIVKDSENETGDAAGVQFGIDVRLWENVGYFDYEDTDRWHDHSVLAIVWRWGVYLAWRGGKKR